MLKDIKSELRTNDLLVADFPEVCQPVRHLQNSPLRARGQHVNGTPTNIEWSKDEIVFPNIVGSVCRESRITALGIEAAIRGQQAATSFGENMRPDFVLVDDPQTKSSARSESETNFRLEVIMGDVLGLGGPGNTIAGLLPCTIIQKGDLADFVTDPKQAPEWRGERTKMVYSFPKNEAKWEDYFRTRENELEAGGDGSETTKYYLSERAAFDEGAEVAWQERHPGFASAIEYAMYLRYRKPEMFFAEYQNEPVDTKPTDANFLDAQAIVHKQHGYERGIVPPQATTLTAFIDVQDDVLFWLVAAWDPGFSGWVLDYGAFPDQHVTYFTLANIRNTLTGAFPHIGKEGRIFKGLGQLVTHLEGRTFVTHGDQYRHKISRIFIDSGDNTSTIYDFCLQHGGIVLPSRGRGVKAGNTPFSEFRPKPGERHGDNWLIGPVASNRSIRLVQFDANAWKTFVQTRFATSLGDPGALSLFKASTFDHRLIADHITCEAATKTEGHGRTLYEWSNPSRGDNHWFDCLVGAAVAASFEGVSLGQLAVKKPAKPLKLSELQQSRRRAYG